MALNQKVSQWLKLSITFLLQSPRHRTISDPSHIHQPTIVEELLAMPKQAVLQAEEFVKKVLSAGWRVVSHHALPEWLQVRLRQYEPVSRNSYKLLCAPSKTQIRLRIQNLDRFSIGSQVEN